MTFCDFHNDAMTCAACGYRAKSLATYRECRPVPPKPWRPIMVGDLLEKALTSVGITQDRVEAITRTAGKPGGCGCQQRKRWMNDVGIKVQRAAINAVMAANKFYFGMDNH